MRSAKAVCSVLVWATGQVKWSLPDAHTGIFHCRYAAEEYG